jgi:SAM-dependent methyltransferase
VDPRPSDHLLRTLAAVPPGTLILDLGCGTGRHTEPLAQLGFDVWACDPDPDVVATNRQRLAGLMGEAAAAQRITLARPAALGYPDDHFDWVVSFGAYDGARDALELFDMLAETRRVLRSGGWVFVAVHTAAAGEDLTPETLSKLLSEAGFALAELPETEVDPEHVVRGIFRKVGSGTAV